VLQLGLRGQPLLILLPHLRRNGKTRQ
jgi:hypothetical protein